MPMRKHPDMGADYAAPAVTIRARSPSLQSLNECELRAIENLFAWVAAEQDTAPETVRAVTEVRFGKDEVGQLERKDYDEVIRFLVDLRIDEYRN